MALLGSPRSDDSIMSISIRGVGKGSILDCFKRLCLLPGFRNTKSRSDYHHVAFQTTGVDRSGLCNKQGKHGFQVDDRRG